MSASATLPTIDTEGLLKLSRLTITQLARREGVHAATCWRWVLSGVRGLRLRSIRVGGRRFVLESDWQEFSQKLNADLQDAPTDPASAAVTARAEAAGKELDALLGSRRRSAPR